jgi:hypothetical protein
MRVRKRQVCGETIPQGYAIIYPRCRIALKEPNRPVLQNVLSDPLVVHDGPLDVHDGIMQDAACRASRLPHTYPLGE